MKNKLLILSLSLSSLFFSMTHASEEKFKEGKAAIVSFTKTEMEYKCQMIEKKIKKLEERIALYNSYSSDEQEIDEEYSYSRADWTDRINSLKDKIKRYEEKLVSIRAIKDSLDTLK